MFRNTVIFLLTIFVIKSSRISDASPFADGYDRTNLRFDCGSPDHYISSFLVCDGTVDCKDGSEKDEKNCRKLCSSDPSGDKCINEICYLNSTRSESSGKVKICTNRSIEDKCTPTRYGVVGAFYCKPGECLPLNETCYSSDRDCKETGGKFQCPKFNPIITTEAPPPNNETGVPNANEFGGSTSRTVGISIAVILLIFHIRNLACYMSFRVINKFSLIVSTQ